ncbi:MAG: glycosyltransferase family 4 protein [Candidatus Acidiferrales bacterium]
MKGRVFILALNPPETPGGVEHFVRELSGCLEAKGYSVELFHWRNSLPLWVARLPGKIGRKISNSLQGWFIGRRVEAQLGRDVVAVISNSNVGYYPLRRYSDHLKLIHVYHGTYRGQAQAIRPFISYLGYLYLTWWDSMVLERLSGRGKTVLCCSDPVRDEVANFFGYQGATSWYPIDLDRFRPHDQTECRRVLGTPEGTPVGLFVGNLSPMKNFPMVRALIDAFPQVQWVLALRGEVPQDLSERPGLKIFQNATPDQLPLLYSAATFSLCPSRYDPFPYVVPESLACGTPVIAAPHGSSRFFLTDPPLDRLLLPDADAKEAFIAAIREVLNDPETYRQAVFEQVRPKLVETMAPENWWRRFCEVTGL